MKKILFLITVGSLIFVSCQKTKDPGATAAVSMANEWWVTLDQGSTKDVFGIGHYKIATYNTSDNGNMMWVDDFKNGYGEKAKVTANYSALTFSGNASANAYYDSTHPSSFPLTVNITDGKVITKGGHSKSGNIVDSLHMKIEFSDDPGTIYEMNGVARTRFAEDDY